MEEREVKFRVQEALLRGLHKDGLISQDEMWDTIEYLRNKKRKNKKIMAIS